MRTTPVRRRCCIKAGTESVVRTSKKSTPRLSDFLPQHEDAWLAAIDAYLKDAVALYEVSDGGR